MSVLFFGLWRIDVLFLSSLKYYSDHKMPLHIRWTLALSTKGKRIVYVPNLMEREGGSVGGGVQLG